LADWCPFAVNGCWALCDNIYECVCVVTTVAMEMLLRDFGPYGIMFMTVCVFLLFYIFLVILDGQFTSRFLIACISVTSSLKQLTDWISN
jgi:hypothetical protein